jgi:4-amino-4-deoxy-L-arabinose transferase-like glycosyltransferase
VLRLTRSEFGRQPFFVVAGAAALALRLLWIFFFPAIVDDSRLYANIADNWLRHGVYGITNSGRIMPTLSRLPGYPAFLAAIFTLFGTDNFRAVLLVQAFFDLATCFLIAHLAWRIFSSRAAKAAFLMAGLCPFLANYAATALTETLEIFFTVLALDLAVLALRADQRNEKQRRYFLMWLYCGFAIAGAILLRPDGGILLAAIGGYLLWLLLRSLPRPNTEFGHHTPRIILAGVLLAIGALAPLIPWTLRNLHTLHRFQPLAPRYANDSDEVLMPGFNRWTKTWMAEYVSVEEIYWKVPGDALDLTLLPDRAFDSPRERERTAELFYAYNRDHDMTREIDNGFGRLAAERIHTDALRYYIWLPAVRVADMWLRPRTESLPSDPRWWEFNDDPRWLTVSLVFGFINLLYVAMAIAGWTRSYGFLGVGLLVFFLLLRSAFLGTLENPEPRYTLECYPVVIILAAALFPPRK